jgi:FkbM family methyltransferase
MAASTSVPQRAVHADGRRETAEQRVDLLTGVRGQAVSGFVHALHRMGALWRVNFTVTAAWRGRRFAIPLLFGNGVQNLTTGEAWMVDLLGRLLPRRAGAFVDVGANLGQTLIKVKLLDPDRPYFGFEPSPVACAYLQQLARSNGFVHTHIIPAALSRADAVAPLFSKADADPSASIVEGFRRSDRYSRVEYVSVHAGDEVLAAVDAGPVGVVKVDVEGAELDVLCGLANTLEADRPYVLCEVLPVYDPDTPTGMLRRDRQAQLEQFLTSMAYAIYRIGPDVLPAEIDRFGIHGDISLSNYLFAPRELAPPPLHT